MVEISLSGSGGGPRKVTTWGYPTGWRLPNVREMQSMVDRAVFQPATDLKAFAGTPNTYFWTSTPWMGGGQTWFVYFDDGHAKHDYSFATYRVRCVR